MLNCKLKTTPFLLFFLFCFPIWSYPQSTEVSIAYLDQEDAPIVYQEALRFLEFIETKNYDAISQRMKYVEPAHRWEGKALRQRVRWMSSLMKKPDVRDNFIGKTATLAQLKRKGGVRMLRRIASNDINIMVSIYRKFSKKAKKRNSFQLIYDTNGTLLKITLDATPKQVEKFQDDKKSPQNPHPLLAGATIEAIEPYLLEGKWELVKTEWVHQDEEGHFVKAEPLDWQQYLAYKNMQFDKTATFQFDEKSKKKKRVQLEGTFIINDNTLTLKQNFFDNDVYAIEALSEYQLVLLGYRKCWYCLHRQRNYYKRVSPVSFNKTTFDRTQQQLKSPPTLPKVTRLDALETVKNDYYYWMIDKHKTIGVPYTGQVEDYYNKILKSKGQLKEGLKEGFWKYYDGSGLLRKGAYQAGKKEGKWEYFTYGNLASQEIEYRADEWHGNYKDWYKTGVLKTKGMYKDNKKHGDFIYYDSTGVKIKLETYENNQLVSDRHFATNGGVTLDDLTLTDGIYYFKRQPFSGQALDYYVPKKRYEGKEIKCDYTLENGIFHGPYAEYFEWDSIRVVGEYKNGKKEGLWQMYYHENFLWQTTNYVAGKKEGLYTHWAQNGNIFVTTEFQNNLRHGKYRQWTHDGKNLAQEGEYWKGIKHGRWVWNDWKFEYYDKGQPTGTWVEFEDKARHQETDGGARIEKRFH